VQAMLPEGFPFHQFIITNSGDIQITTRYVTCAISLGWTAGGTYGLDYRQDWRL